MYTLYYKELFYLSTFSVYCSKILLFIRQLDSTWALSIVKGIESFFYQIISLAHISSHTLRPLNILFVFQLLTSLTCPTRVYLGELLIHCFSHLILTHSVGGLTRPFCWRPPRGSSCSFSGYCNSSSKYLSGSHTALWTKLVLRVAIFGALHKVFLWVVFKKCTSS